MLCDETPLQGPATITMWLPNIPNELEKLRDIKSLDPKTILITSKRNIDNKYSFQDVVAHGLSKKSNLIIEIQQSSSRGYINKGIHFYVGRLIDTLGNQWYPRRSEFTPDFRALAIESVKRAIYLSTITREASVKSPEKPDDIPDTKEINTFFKLVKDHAEIFHKLVKPSKKSTRFLGNASFRCTRGFPSMKLPDGRIYVSRRNVDKRHIGPETFVQVGFNTKDKVLWYRGANKPSVDTPIQVRLYGMFPEVNYMIHSHTYVKGAPFTKKMVPCGGLEEMQEVTNLYNSNNRMLRLPEAINLVGHGSIVLMRKPSDINSFEFVSRPSPEIQLLSVDKFFGPTKTVS